ncbi:hypothetical protein GCM10023322_83340 [Rugosimonospora acidiphila]|uniref:Enolase C-terminal domain-containing protein n=1 Tax=Rugosimonospora acidiphila TaxID=556531 RepID=A0ABP9SSS0_9ACTN
MFLNNTLKDAMFVEQLELTAEGNLKVPDRPGLGSTLDDVAMKRFQVAGD